MALEKTQPIFDLVVNSNSTYEPNKSVVEFESDIVLNVLLFVFA